MRSLKVFFLGLGIIISNLYGHNLEVEYAKAMDRLNNGKELYFSFYANSLLSLEEIDRVVSVDKREGSLVYAYAGNKQQFENFLDFDLVYHVEIHPGERFPVECSDYKNFKTSDRIDKWPSYEGYLNLMEQFETDYPDLIEVKEFGESIKGRKMLCAVITGKKEIPRPNVLWLGAIHGDELTGTMCSFRMIQYLMERYKADDPRIMRIVDSTQIWIVPFQNPDGTYAGGNSSVYGARRTNANGVDLNRSFKCLPGVIPDAKEQQETRNSYKLVEENFFTIGCDSHGGVECYIHPWSHKSQAHPQAALYKKMGEYLVDKTVGGISGGVGTPFETIGYTGNGTQTDYMDYHGKVMNFCFEMSRTKLIKENDFDRYWDKYREMMLSFYELAFTGIQGIIRDSVTNKGIDSVEVMVEGENEDFLKRYSYNGGFYCRMIIDGTYTLKFSHKDYYPRTIQNVQVVSLKRTPLSIKMMPLNSGIVKNSFVQNHPLLNIVRQKGKVIFTVTGKAKLSDIRLYTINGKLVQVIQPDNDSDHYIWDQNPGKIAMGCYFVGIKFDGKNALKRFILTQ